MSHTSSRHRARQKDARSPAAAEPRYPLENLRRAAGEILADFPEHQDPLTYQQSEVEALLRKAAYFPIFSVPGGTNAPVTLPFLPFALVAVFVNESLHRFNVVVEPPTRDQGLKAVNETGEAQVASISMRWSPFPDNYNPDPDTVPPLTPLQPWCSQGFTLQSGLFLFRDDNQSGFRGFGVGRTFPAQEGGKPVLRAGGIISLLQGFRDLEGLPGNMVVNGFIVPPQGLGLGLMLRVMDPDGRLEARSWDEIPALEPIPNPDPEATFLNFLTEPDPQFPVALKFGEDGRITGWTWNLNLRLVRVGFAVRGKRNLRSKTEAGEIVGRVTGEVVCQPFNSDWDAIPFQTKNTTFTFLDQAGQILSSLEADLVEGYLFPTRLAERQVFRTTGFGPFREGTGQFSGVQGMASFNGAESLFPYAESGMLTLRVVDPDGSFKATVPSHWNP